MHSTECETSAPRPLRAPREISRNPISDQLRDKAEALEKVLLQMAAENDKSPFIRRDHEFWQEVCNKVSSLEDKFHPAISNLKKHNAEGLLQFFEARTMKFLPPGNVKELERLK
jgi:hypothetical protein